MLRRAVRFGLLGVAVTAWALFVPAALAGAGNGIANSPHDLSGDLGTFDTGELCRVCHVPHDHARDTGLVGLLWNHELSAATYTMYESSSLDGAQDGQPTGISKMCLGCHDGTVALDAYDSNIGSGDPTTVIQDYWDPDLQVPNIPGSTNPDLRATHPISIEYAGGSDPGLNPQSTSMGGSGVIADVLEDGKVQCHSCHDVHDGIGESVSGTRLLRVAQTGAVPSGLCLTCHNK